MRNCEMRGKCIVIDMSQDGLVLGLCSDFSSFLMSKCQSI
jgi:hypothetical protein